MESTDTAVRPIDENRIESDSLSDFAKIMQAGDLSGQRDKKAKPKAPGRIELDGENVKNSLAQVVLTLVKLLHELLERQAIRRIDAGTLTDEQIESLGLALMKQSEEIKRLCKEFGLEDDDLNLDLGPLGKLL